MTRLLIMLYLAVGFESESIGEYDCSLVYLEEGNFFGDASVTIVG